MPYRHRLETLPATSARCVPANPCFRAVRSCRLSGTFRSGWKACRPAIRYTVCSIDGFSSFPDSADKDHDGIVYLLTNAKGKKNAIDAADLKKWVDSYLKVQKKFPSPIKDSDGNYDCLRGIQVSLTAYRPAHLRGACPSVLRTLLRGRTHHILCILRINAWRQPSFKARFTSLSSPEWNVRIATRPPGFKAPGSFSINS